MVWHRVNCVWSYAKKLCYEVKRGSFMIHARCFQTDTKILCPLFVCIHAKLAASYSLPTMAGPSIYIWLIWVSEIYFPVTHFYSLNEAVICDWMFCVERLPNNSKQIRSAYDMEATDMTQLRPGSLMTALKVIMSVESEGFDWNPLGPFSTRYFGIVSESGHRTCFMHDPVFT